MGAQTYENIRSGKTEKPNRDKVICLGVAFRLRGQEFIDFMKSFGYGDFPGRNRIDCVVAAFIDRLPSNERLEKEGVTTYRLICELQMAIDFYCDHYNMDQHTLNVFNG